MQVKRSSASESIHARRGAATVEFALVAPLFLMLVLGLTEYSKAINTYNVMFASVREGGRLASMDFSSYVTNSQSANQKVVQEIRGFLAASGLPADELTITITEVDSADEFNIGDSNNYLRSFRVTASIPFSAVSNMPLNYLQGHTLSASMVYRRGRVQMVQ